MKKRIACLLLTFVMLVGMIPTAAIHASAASFAISASGIRVIKNYVGFHKTAYETSSGYKIGYGTPSVKDAVITEANADKYLREELEKIASTLNGVFAGVELVQKRMDALLWYSYIYGTDWATTGSAMAYAVANQLEGSALVDAMCTWDYEAGGFPNTDSARSRITRRLAMANLYLNGTYSATNTGSLGYTVFDAGKGTMGGRRYMVQAFAGTTKIKVADPTNGTSKFLGWYNGDSMVTGVGKSTNGKTLSARWQNDDKKVSANYTLPAYVIYKASGTPDNGQVVVYKSPTDLTKIDVVNRDVVVTVQAEKIVGTEKWIQLSTGGWVLLCSSLNDLPTIIPSVTITITDDYVNVRQDPDPNSTKLGTLKRGDKRTIAMLSDDGRWGYCAQGWIFLAYTTYGSSSSSSSGSSGSNQLGTGTPGVVTGATRVNVRSGAGVGNALVTTLAEGTAITVYEQTTADGAPWGHIDQGWISMGYVKLNKPTTTTPTTPTVSTGASAVVSSSVSLNVRSGPGTTYPKVTSLLPGTSVVILRQETVSGVTWGLIDQGWINLSYVTPIASTNTGSGESSVYSVGGTVVNCSTGVNIRAAAGTTNALIGVAGVGTRVNVTEITTVNGYKWGHIERGWVCMDYIQLDSTFAPPSTEPTDPSIPNFNDDVDMNVVATFEGYPATTVNPLGAKMYKTASVHADVLMMLDVNATVNIMAMTQNGNNRYGKVTVGSTTGWVSLNDLQINDFHAKVTAASTDVYEQPSTRSTFFATLLKGTYITVPTDDDFDDIENEHWAISDGALWGEVTVTVSGVTYLGWLKMADVTMFKGNEAPLGVTSTNGVGYLTGTMKDNAPVLQDRNGNPVYRDSLGSIAENEYSAYTQTAGTRVNIQARCYIPETGKTYGKVIVGSVYGWIDMDKVELDMLTVKANVSLSALRQSDMTFHTIAPGHTFTVIERALMDNPIEINHGVADIGYGYLDDNTTDLFLFALDDGKLTPTAKPTNVNPANPVVVSSVVVTGTAKIDLPIYEEALLTSRELLRVNQNAQITILNWKNVDGITWGKVQVNQIVGWVKVADVSFPNLTGKVKTDPLTVYSSADKASSTQVLRTNNKAIEIGASLYFDGTTVWGAVNVSGFPGYIDLNDVTLSAYNFNEIPDTAYRPSIAKARINSVNASINVNGEVIMLPKSTEVSLIDVQVTPNASGVLEVLWLIDLGDKDGWINMDCLNMYHAVATVTEPRADVFDDLTLSKVIYKLYRDEKATILSFHLYGDTLYGEVAYQNTTGWIKIHDDTGYRFVGLVPGSTGTTIDGGSTTDPTTPTNPTNPTNPTTTPTVEPTAAHIVCNTTVNVRSGPGVANTLVTTLPNGTNVKIYEKAVDMGKEWARIDQGWVCMDYVALGNLATAPSGGGATNGGSGTVTIITTVPAGAIAVGYANEDIKVRTGSNMGYPEVGTVRKGSSVVIYENKLDGGMSWGRTDNGWVCTSYLTITGIGATGSGQMGTIARCGYTANVRSSSNSNSALMAKVMITSRVVVRETLNLGGEGWVRTDLGWINMEYVVMDATTSTPDNGTTSNPGGGSTQEPTTAPTEAPENEFGEVG